jgi:hypothetical protein
MANLRYIRVASFGMVFWGLSSMREAIQKHHDGRKFYDAMDRHDAFALRFVIDPLLNWLYFEPKPIPLFELVVF